MNLAAHVRASVERDPERPALVTLDESISYRQLWDWSSRIIPVLRRAGIGRGDPVLLHSSNSPFFFALYVAAARIGALFAPVHASFRARELEYILRNSAAAVAFVEPRLRGQMEATVAGVSGIVPPTILDAPLRWEPESNSGRLTPSSDVLDVPDSHPALIAYTSGSRSAVLTPVTRSHGGEAWNALTYAKVWDITAEDCVLDALPLSWVYGLSSVGLPALCVGATLVIQKEDGSQAMLPVIEQHRVTVFAGTMTMYSSLLVELQRRGHDHSSLRRLFVGGESVLPSIIELVEHYTGIRPLQAYATTEVAPVLSLNPHDESIPPEGTVGRLVEGSEIRLVDRSGADVPVGRVGEGWLRSPGQMLGYWREPELTAARVTSDGWYRSGDLLWCDADGYYYMLGREEDVVFRESAKVALSEVEGAVASVDGVADVVVVAVPDEEFGEAIIAFVVLAPGRSISIDTIYDELGARIARFKLPREIHILKQLPLGFTGKRDRRRLRALAQSRAAGDRTVISLDEWLAGRSHGSSG